MADIQHSTLSGSELHEPKSHTHDTLYLKRSADDFNSAGVEKGSPANADRVLIEDSADVLAKKWAQVGNLPGGGGAGDMAKAVYDPNDDGVFAIAQGGTGQSTAQAAMNAISQVSGATNEHVLTKDTGTGNAAWKVSAGGGGTSDHGALTGLADDDHSQYLLVNGTRAMAGDLDVGDHHINGVNDIQAHDGLGILIRDYLGVVYARLASDQYTTNRFYQTVDMSSKKITLLADPTSDQDAATKKYVDDTTGAWEVSGTELQMATVRGMGMQGEDILYTGDVVPQTNNLSNLGSASYLWANVFATNGIFGDLGFEEKECHVCKEKFKVGDVIDLIIKSIESHGIMTVPVHKECNR